ncbi:MAG: exodeoxyribonuclease VII large subunit [Eubacteriales bacterium]|nr:exodeoxyribonuclease VII large subunit [Eubacteriales bacterium]
MEQKVFSVSELNNHIKDLLELDPMLAQVRVRGELSNYRVYPSGHHYFTLKDAGGSLRCVMFKSQAVRLRFRPESGMGVVAYGRVSVFPRDGAYQLYCSTLSPEGLGDLYLAYEQLKAKLASEGLFNPEHKKDLPRFPSKIAVITSGAGAAVRDIIRICNRRWPMAKILVLPVRVQGVEAPPEIVGAIRYANRFRVADLIITGRGGGSLEDLWAFNDERVARAIFESELPVISAVGHEPDVTIADFVADVRAATPSHAAEIAVPDQEELRATVSALERRVSVAAEKQFSALRQRLEDLQTRRVLESPRTVIDQKRMELDLVMGRASAAADRLLSERRQQFVQLTASLNALSPLKVLSRGFSIVTNEKGIIIRDAEAAEPGESVDITLAQGKLRCVVEEQIWQKNN